MTTDFSIELNKYFEIIGLLYNSNQPKFITNEVVEKTATEFGINADELNKKVVVVLKKYIAAFQKEMIKNNTDDFDFFFSEEDDDFILSIQYVCSNHQEWFEQDFENLTEREILLAFAEVLFEETIIPADTPSFNKLIALLSETGFSANTCWKLMLIFQSPKEKIEKLSKIINSNIAAYEKAIITIQKPLNKLLEKFPHGEFIGGPLHQNSHITPTLIYPAVELVNINGTFSNSYIGLFTDDVYKMQQKSKTAQKNILPMLKAISDNSKFDILLSLIKAPKYNLELAEELNLSAATISHHMNVLLTCHLVSVEKRDGRVYYTLSKNTIENLLLDLHNKFLG
nr:winged helix-turn-helix domain-containing protein [uncultured Anaerosporobacter sp.]